MLPRLLHLPRVGITRLRLLVPAEAEAFRPMIDFALQAAGLEAETVACPPGSILRVKALHYVSLVGQGWFKSPTVLALFERLRAAAPAAGAVERLFVARPDSGRRRVANAAEAAALAQAMGFTVVEPSVLPFPEPGRAAWPGRSARR
jgi:capsular polysaccharide biosynthesis protein